MSRIRSPSYPDAPLPRVIEVAGKLFDKIRSNAVDRETAVREMGYSGLTGASGKMLANLLHYGLAAKAGKGQVRVTQLAIDILHSTSPDGRKRALHQAGLSPEFFQKIRSNWKDGLPSETWLRSFMMREGFSSVAIDPAISSYLETCRFLQQENAYESHGEPPPPPVDSSQVEDDGGDEMEAAHESRPVQRDKPNPRTITPIDGAGIAERVVFREEGAQGQYLTLKAAGEVTDDMLEALEDYIKRQRKRLERVAP